MFHIPRPTKAYQEIFYANSPTAAGQARGWQIWNRPSNISFVHIFALGGGGPGGNGSASAGGGGGASGAQITLLTNAYLIPPKIFIRVGLGGSSAGINGDATFITTKSGVDGDPTTLSIQNLIYAPGGGSGGTAVTTTAGTAGSATPVGTITDAEFMGPAIKGYTGVITATALLGQAGIIGAVAGAAGAALTLPVTGLVVTGGTGGGGVGGVGANGFAGGAFTVPAGGVFPSQSGGNAGTFSPALGGGRGSNGFKILPDLLYYYGGTGGGSSSGSSGSGGNGGAGGYGCGGGGGGAGIDGAGTGGRGGDGIVIITSW